MSTRSIFLRSLIASLFLIGIPGGLAAQGAAALQKSDVIRLLTGNTYSAEEVATIVGRSCLSFEPTGRDMSNFQSLGASDDVMAAIQECVDAGRVTPSEPARVIAAPVETRPATQPDPPRSQEITLFLSPRRVEVSVGAPARVVAELTRGAGPASGVRLDLRESGPAGLGAILTTAVTDGGGLARFEIPAAVTAGSSRYVVEAIGQDVQGLNEIEVIAKTAEAATAAPLTESDASGLGETYDRAEALRLAEAASLQGRYRSASAIYERLAADAPNHVEVLVPYGLHLSRIGSHEAAATMLERALAIEPNRIDVLKALGFLALWRGEPGDAVDYLRAATERAPADADAWRTLGRALAASGEDREAREAFQRAAELEP